MFYSGYVLVLGMLGGRRGELSDECGTRDGLRVGATCPVASWGVIEGLTATASNIVGARIGVPLGASSMTLLNGLTP